MEIYVPDIVWSILNFFVLLAILNKFLYKPILAILENRKEEIRSNLQNAKTAEEEADKLRQAYKKQLQEAKHEAKDIIDAAHSMAEQRKKEIINEARGEAVEITEKAQATIREEKEKALAQLREEVASLVVLAAGRVIDKSITRQDHEKLIRDTIQEVEGVS